ncbi:MAG: lyase, partial [Gammaproteobacteria bacterium]
STVERIGAGEDLEIVMTPESEPAALAGQKPGNLWLSGLDFDGDEAARERFLRHCASCHPPASGFMRIERSPEQWRDVIDRMSRYGSQLAAEDRKPLADYLRRRFAELGADPGRLPGFEPWPADLSAVEISEWRLGDSFSHLRDFIVHPNGMVYVGDNLMDRIYELDPVSGEYTVYRLPHSASARPGGILGNRLAGGYPRAENLYGVNAFALSAADGHLFIATPMQQALIEFDPLSKQFTEWAMEDGFYPHSLRVDAKDRVWVTLALSNAVAVFDRQEKRFRSVDLPARGIRERLRLAISQFRLARGWFGEPPRYDREGTGFPLPLDLDIAADGTVWVARYQADDLARIDPETLEVRMIPLPFAAPSALRCDAEGNPWVSALSSGLVARYVPARDQWETFPLPLRSDTPLAIAHDPARGLVWVSGNQSDTLLALDPRNGRWKVYPLARQGSFAQAIAVAEDGAVFSSNANFPAWQIEDGQPTLIRLRDAAANLAAP